MGPNGVACREGAPEHPWIERDPNDAPAESSAPCPLCAGDGGEVLWRGDYCRVVLPAEPQWPGLCRVVAGGHAAEMSDLSAPARAAVWAALHATEQVIRERLRPDKVNLASLGNRVEHVHWHLVPRWRDDACFPGSPWSPPLRTAPVRRLPRDFAAVARRLLAAALGG